MLRKVLYFLDFPYSVGGSNKVLLTQAYIMRKRGYDVVVVLPNDEKGGHANTYDEMCRNYGLPTIEATFDMATCMENIDVLSVFEHYTEIMKIISNEKPDLIHSTQINVTVEMIARELNIPHLMNIYQTDIEAFSINWLDIYPHYHSSDSVMTCNRWGDGLNIASRCIRIAYESQSVENKIPFRNNDVVRVINIGGFYERKNQIEILKFVLKCKENDIKIVITFLGNDETEYGEKCKEFVKANNMQNEVIFKGFVSNVESYLRQSDLMILASYVESYPGVVVEGMANHVPILATPVAGLPELLKDGYNSFMTSGYKSNNIYETFIRYKKFLDEDRLQKIIDNAYRTYIQNHTYDSVGYGLERYYDCIIDNYNNRTLRDEVLISDLKRVFNSFIARTDFNSLDIYTKSHLWFLYHLNDKFKEYSHPIIVIWGAGNFGRIALEWMGILEYRDEVLGFLDSNKKGEYLGYPILNNRDKAIKNADIVLIAVGDTKVCLEIMDYVEQRGKKRNENYFLMSNGPMRI